MVSPLVTTPASTIASSADTKPLIPGIPGANIGNSGIVPPDILAQVTQTLQTKNTLAPKLNAALANDRIKLSGLGQLQSALSNFQNVAQSISGAGLNTSATSSVKSVLSAGSSKSALPGKFDVEVTQLAQKQVLQSKAQSTTTVDTPIGTGSPSIIKFDFGSTNTSGFVPNGAAKSVSIKAGSNSLQGIANAINESNIGVSAKLVRNGKDTSLSLTGPSGANQTLRIAVSGDADLQKLLNFNPVGSKNLNQISAAQDAQFKVNGVAGSSASNVITDAIPGTRLELTGKGTSEVVVAQDSVQISNNVSQFVTAFNSLNSKLRSLAQGELKNDGSATRVQDQLTRTLRNNTTTSSDGSSFNLASVGVTIAQNGDLALDKAKLQTAIVTDPSAVSRLFAKENTGLADGLNNQIKSVTGAQGSISRETTAINKDISNLNAKKASLGLALTAQANALIKLYTQQSNALPGLGEQGGRQGGSSLFDIIG